MEVLRRKMFLAIVSIAGDGVNPEIFFTIYCAVQA
jgi:hypothetical protein